MRPELPEALPLPPDDRVGLNVQQRSAPGAPNARQTDPEQPIETAQHRSFPLSPEGSELQAESSVFDSNGLVSAQQETNESNHRQKKGWHVSRLFAFIRFEVNLLWPDGVMAKDRCFSRYTQRLKTVFLAHARAEHDVARQLAEFLEFGCNLTCYVEDGLIGGEQDLIS